VARLGWLVLLAAGCAGTPIEPTTRPKLPAATAEITAIHRAAGCWHHQPTDRKPAAGWDTIDLRGLTREQLLAVLGCPPHIIRMTSLVSADHHRELWVYQPFAEDPTGWYIWLKGNTVHHSALDEFNGFGCHRMMDADFWEQPGN
jgi:hypothetical protein